MTTFFITGLPRSRTAWMAALMTDADTFCWHEAMNGCKTRAEFYGRMCIGGYQNVGNSDSGLVLTDFQRRWPHAPTVIIHRPYDEVMNSLQALGDYAIHRNWVDWIMQLKGLHVNFADLDERIPEIHRYLIGRDIDRRKLQLFQAMNVQLKAIETDEQSYQIWRV